MAPIDWDECWGVNLVAYDRSWTGERGTVLADLLEQFFGRVGVPDSVASVGCGPGPTLIELADRHPDVEWYGYDVSETALDQARAASEERGLDNVTVSLDELPGLQTDRRFEFVYCFATLHYVRRTDEAFRALFDRVEPGGHLVTSHPTPDHENRLLFLLATHAMQEREAVDPDERAFGDRDVEWVRDRFEYVLTGENVLTATDVSDLLGTETTDLRDVDGVSPPPGFGEHLPLTVARKPEE